MSQNVPVVGTTYNVSNYSYTPTGNKDSDIKSFAEKNGLSAEEAKKILENEFSNLNAVKSTEQPNMAGGQDEEIQLNEVPEKKSGTQKTGFDIQQLLSVAEKMELSEMMIAVMQASGEKLVKIYNEIMKSSEGNIEQDYYQIITTFIEDNLVAQKDEEDK